MAATLDTLDTLDTLSPPPAPAPRTAPPVETVHPTHPIGGLYNPPRTPAVVDVPVMTYLTVTGTGAVPGAEDPAWAEAVARLRSGWRRLVGEKASGTGLPPLQVLWEDARRTRWTIMLALLDTPWAATAGGSVAAAPAGCAVRTLHEGWCVQVMYEGEANRAPSLARLDRFLTRHGYQVRGLAEQVHEIFLDDVAPDAGPASPAPRVVVRRRVQPAR